MLCQDSFYLKIKVIPEWATRTCNPRHIAMTHACGNPLDGFGAIFGLRISWIYNFIIRTLKYLVTGLNPTLHFFDREKWRYLDENQHVTLVYTYI